MGKCLQKVGIHVPLPKCAIKIKIEKNTSKFFKLVPINKVDDYGKGEDKNTTF